MATATDADSKIIAQDRKLTHEIVKAGRKFVEAQTALQQHRAANPEVFSTARLVTCNPKLALMFSTEVERMAADL